MKISRDLYGSKRELIFVGSIIMILGVLFVPISSVLLDVLLIANLSFAMGILTLTIYTDKPTSFSTFPSILLLATLFRLALNIAATRLILDGAHAGDVIGAIGSYVVGGNFVIGLVVFFILIVVQYVVVTNGAQRIAEVAARFTLDSMPGKQMSIDADLNMGIIDHQQANERRKEVEKEASFYGAMDGASKFVKGDAIAGIVIILIDIIGGLTVGIAQLGMEWGDAMHTYTLLTVGDGIVTQIPALVISVATGIIVTRAASDGELGKEIFDQVSEYPKAIVLIMISLVVLMFLPSMPVFPILLMLAVLAIALYFIVQPDEEEVEEEDLYDHLAEDDLAIVISTSIFESLGGSGWFEEKVKKIKRDYAKRLGIVLPEIVIVTSSSLKADYEIRFHGALLTSGKIEAGKTLAIIPSSDALILDGVRTKDPAFGLDAIWIEQEKSEEAAKFGYTLIEADAVLVTHISEVIRKNLEEFVNRKYVEMVLEKARKSNSSLVEEIIPEKLSIYRFTTLLKRMISENISVTSVSRMIEVLSEIDVAELNDNVLFEIVRQKMALHICTPLVENNSLKVIAMGGELERSLIDRVATNSEAYNMSMKSDEFEKFMKSAMLMTDKLIKSGRKPVILTAPMIRRSVYDALSRSVPGIAVISTKEVPKGIALEAVDILR